MSKVALGTVRSQVRQNALMLPNFSIAQLVTMTGLVRSSIDTEVQRMIAEGFITSDGRKPATYNVTTDPEKRLALSHSITLSKIHSDFPRPTSRFYREAEDLITNILNTLMVSGQSHDSIDGGPQEKLNQAEELLDFALEDEGWRSAPPSIICYLDYEHARLRFLRGQHQEAERMFKSLLPEFNHYLDKEKIRLIEEYLQLLRTQTAKPPDTDSHQEAHTWLDLILGSVEGISFGPTLLTSPIAALSVQAITSHQSLLMPAIRGSNAVSREAYLRCRLILRYRPNPGAQAKL